MQDNILTIEIEGQTPDFLDPPLPDGSNVQNLMLIMKVRFSGREFELDRMGIHGMYDRENSKFIFSPSSMFGIAWLVSRILEKHQVTVIREVNGHVAASVAAFLNERETEPVS